MKVYIVRECIEYEESYNVKAFKSEDKADEYCALCNATKGPDEIYSFFIVSSLEYDNS